MSRGDVHTAADRLTTDHRTGATIRQVTDTDCVTHHPYFFNPAYDRAMDWLVVVSHRTGRPEIYGLDRGGGGARTDAAGAELVQFTEDPGIDEWSVVPGPDGDAVYFTAGGRACRVRTDDCETEVLVDFTGTDPDRPGSPVSGAATVGTGAATVETGGATGLSPDGEWWAVPVTVEDAMQLVVIDTASGAAESILERDVVVQPQFCPDDPGLLFYAGPLTDRPWLIERDGSNDRRLYDRDPGEWITHESWLPGRREVALVDWPNGVRAIDVDTGVERRVTDCNAWHAAAGPEGELMVADTNFPDVGLQLFDPRDGVAKTRTLCYPAASSIGEHWDGPFPYADGPIETYSPQHTHPHPRFSPDGERVVYTSDRSGFANVYEVDVPTR